MKLGLQRLYRDVLDIFGKKCVFSPQIAAVDSIETVEVLEIGMDLSSNCLQLQDVHCLQIKPYL